jgi:hypothetical protein
MTPEPPPFWNPIARYRAWSRENPAQAQIAIITAIFIGFIVLMGIATAAVVIGLLRD